MQPLAPCVQVDAVCINFVFQETSMGIHYNTEGQMDLLDYVKNKEVRAAAAPRTLQTAP